MISVLAGIGGGWAWAEKVKGVEKEDQFMI